MNVEDVSAEMEIELYLYLIQLCVEKGVLTRVSSTSFPNTNYVLYRR